MTGTYAYRLLPPCVDHHGHKFGASAEQPHRSVCPRCGVQVDATNNQFPDPTEPRTLFPLKISEALENRRSQLVIEHDAGDIYGVVLYPGSKAHPTTHATGTNLAQALTNLALKLIKKEGDTDG